MPAAVEQSEIGPDEDNSIKEQEASKKVWIAAMWLAGASLQTIKTNTA
jgi:hypothetical protein